MDNLTTDSYGPQNIDVTYENFDASKQVNDVLSSDIEKLEIGDTVLVATPNGLMGSTVTQVTDDEEIHVEEEKFPLKPSQLGKKGDWAVVDISSADDAARLVLLPIDRIDANEQTCRFRDDDNIYHVDFNNLTPLSQYPRPLLEAIETIKNSPAETRKKQAAFSSRKQDILVHNGRETEIKFNTGVVNGKITDLDMHGSPTRALDVSLDDVVTTDCWVLVPNELGDLDLAIVSNISISPPYSITCEVKDPTTGILRPGVKKFNVQDITLLSSLSDELLTQMQAQHKTRKS